MAQMRHPALFLLLPFTALATSPLGAQRGDPALERRVDSVFAGFARSFTPGCAVGADRAGVPVVRRAYGLSNLETGTLFTTGTISESGSVAKQFVATGLVLLVLDGKLSLDDDITKWIPEVSKLGKRITVRHLLSHTSGLPDRYLLHAMAGRPAGDVDHTNAEVLDIVSGLRELNFDPGEDYLYSNTGYVVAVAVLERVSGQTLQQFSQARIFGPLGMRDTRWREDHRVIVQGRASAYGGSPAAGFENEHPFTRVFGSGGLLTTVDDFLKWSDAFQRGTGSWGAVRDSLSAVIRLNEGTAITYGLGVTTDEWRGVRRVSHTGSTGGYRAALYRFPQQQVSVALLCNIGAANPAALATAVATIVLGDALAPVVADATPAIAMTREALDAIAGAYWSPRTEEVAILVVRDGNLVDSLSNTVFLPRGGGRFRVRGGASELEVTRTGMQAGLRVTAPHSRATEYQRVERAAMTGAVAMTYAGSYRSPELDAPIELVAHGDTVKVDGGWQGFTVLRPLYRDGFSAGGGRIVRFTRDSRGRITGFVIWAGRVRHLRFDRVPTR
jgi:CubicO group peptidase (beta-lactamase class C family)